MKILPKKVIVGYANWGQCDEGLITAVKNGVNVLMWFSIDFIARSGKPFIDRGPDLECAAKIAMQIQNLGLETIHFISVGGWNAAHIDNSVSAQDYYKEFDKWNKERVARHGWSGFDGIDWDLEGRDDPDSPTNTFTVQGLHSMGIISQLAKDDGYLVSLAPAQSYMDYSTTVFSRSLRNPPVAGDHQDFLYHGRNCYSYLLSKYASTSRGARTFDFVFYQFYETYSKLLFDVQQIPASDAIYDAVKALQNGWNVDFSTDKELGWHVNGTVSVEATRLVVGLANAWAHNSERTLFVPTEHVHKAYKRLKGEGIDLLGFGFWTIGEEGRQVNGRKLFLASELNSFLQIRPTNHSDEL